MNTSHLNIGIIHSLIGKNDGVSIVIDQTVNAMIDYMNIDLGNIYFLGAHSSPRFNAETNEIFWHKSEMHKYILRTFSEPPTEGLDKMIHEKAVEAKKIIKQFVEKNKLDLIIAHNTSHPYNFITAIGLGYYMEELRKEGIIWPKLLVWWHDSYFEREKFKNPNEVVQQYLRFLPGTYIDGMVFINSGQPDLAKRLLQKLNHQKLDTFFKERTEIIPNTCEIPWDWKERDWNSGRLIYPEQDNYNDTFFRDVGLLDELDAKGFGIEETVILLQHTRVVPRKNIEKAIDFAFKLDKKFRKQGLVKCFVVLVSGHSGDEEVDYKKFLVDYKDKMLQENPDAHFLLIFGENNILTHRDIIVDKKYYKFKEVPSIIASVGGIGTYFSEVEGYGNNLLEMISMGLPVFINKYDVYKKDIEHLGFKLPAVENGTLNDEIIEEAYSVLTDMKKRNEMIHHNIKNLHEKLDHAIIAEKLNPLIERIFTKMLSYKK